LALFIFFTFKPYQSSLDANISRVKTLRIFVINLDRPPDRLAYITNEFGKIGLEFTRIAAIDGRLLPEEEYQRLIKDNFWDPPLLQTVDASLVL